MTPKQKAKELYNKMYNFNMLEGSYQMSREVSKWSALIAVDEMQLIMTSLWTASGINENHRSTYLEEVKKEIEKL